MEHCSWLLPEQMAKPAFLIGCWFGMGGLFTFEFNKLGLSQEVGYWLVLWYHLDNARFEGVATVIWLVPDTLEYLLCSCLSLTCYLMQVSNAPWRVDLKLAFLSWQGPSYSVYRFMD